MFQIIHHDNTLFRFQPDTGELERMYFLPKAQGGTCFARIGEYIPEKRRLTPKKQGKKKA